MVRIDLDTSANSYLLKIQFKRWGKLWAPGNIKLYSSEAAARIEARDYKIGRVVQQLTSSSLVQIAAKKRYAFKKYVARARKATNQLPTSFVVECYNPQNDPVQMSLTMRAIGERSRMPFQKLLEIAPGFQRLNVPVPEIEAYLDISSPFDIELVPNDDQHETTLYFGQLEFVVEAPEPKAKARKVKCVVWDLDHTVWNGVLVEGGVENLRLKPGIGEVIQSLDARGILQSIASKNNQGDALAALARFDLADYFLCPQISWNPKSQGVQSIAQQLNIGLDSLLFLDDSPFERAEVEAVCPEVRTLPAEEYATLLAREELQVPVTDESRERRKLYQVEMTRQALARNFSGDYLQFLRDCQIRVTIRPMTEVNLERVHELTQRTNQMNFSGNRYDRDVLKSLLTNPDLDTFVLSCEDRFGSYGVIGFSIVDRRETRMTDLMFSCRIQAKRVEHAFLSYAIRLYTAETGREFYADYRKTPRNAPSGQVFADLSMEELEISNGVSLFRFPKNQRIPDDGVIEIVVPEDAMVQPA